MDPSTNMLLFESKQPPVYYVVTAVLTSWLPDVPDANRLLTLNPYLDFSCPVIGMITEMCTCTHPI